VQLHSELVLDSVEEWMQSQSDCDEFEVAQHTLDVARVIESQNVTLDSLLSAYSC